MTIITIDDRSFSPTAIQNTTSTDCCIGGEEHTYIDFFFEEDGKTHFVRQITNHNEKERTYKIDYSVPAKWFVEE